MIAVDLKLLHDDDLGLKYFYFLLSDFLLSALKQKVKILIFEYICKFNEASWSDECAVLNVNRCFYQFSHFLSFLYVKNFCPISCYGVKQRLLIVGLFKVIKVKTVLIDKNPHIVVVAPLYCQMARR